MQHSNHTAIQSPKSRTAAFVATFFLLFALMYGFLAVVDALPEPSHSLTHTTNNTVVKSSQPEAPVRVVAPSLGLDVSVSNPSSTNVDVLDVALLKGSVRYPTSALLGVDGTVLLFGHSSYLPIVHNQAYKSFNRIQDLKVGEMVSVYSGTREYRYKVAGVRVANATEDVVELSATGKHLVMVTCDSFVSKSSRFVVSADFVGTYALASN